MPQAPHTTARPVLTHTLGFPAWAPARAEIRARIALARRQHRRRPAARRNCASSIWQIQADAGLGFVTVGDFALYDHVANHIQLLGCEPARFAFGTEAPELHRYFAMARGVSATAEHAHTDCGPGCHAPQHGSGQPALEMTQVVRHQLPLPGARVPCRHSVQRGQ